MQNKNILFSSIVSIICSSTLVVAGVILSSASVKADVIDTVSVRVPVSCSMLVDSTTNEPHRTSVENGIYRDDIGTTTVKAFCNDIEGLSIYAIGFTDEVSGKNVLASATLGETEDIVTGTAKAGANSNWAMKLNTDSTADYGIEITNGFDDYSEVPTEFTKVATRESGTDLGELAKGATFTTTYAVYIDTRKPADTYAGKVKYIMLHPATEEIPHEIKTESYQIGYYPNTVTTVGSMEKQSISESDTSIRLKVPNFSRDNYGFAGWNDKYDYSGNYYGPNETIYFDAGQYSGDNSGLSLYAVWVESRGNIQDWQGCDSLANGETTALTDIRDNQTYAIAKLADGKCWMIENLRLDNDALTNSSGSLAQGYNSSFIGLANSESQNFDDATAPNSVYGINGSGSSYIIEGPNAKYRFPRYNNANTANRVATMTNDDANIYGYGNYYTWAAAIADTSNYESGHHNATSICPSGWHIPTGQTNGEIYKLNYEIDGNIDTDNYVTNDEIRKYPNNFIFSGYYDGSSAVDRGYSGNYWSSSASSVNGSNYLYMFDSRVYPGTIGFYKNNGQSIRCVAND